MVTIASILYRLILWSCMNVIQKLFFKTLIPSKLIFVSKRLSKSPNYCLSHRNKLVGSSCCSLIRLFSFHIWPSFWHIPKIINVWIFFWTLIFMISIFRKFLHELSDIVDTLLHELPYSYMTLFIERLKHKPFPQLSTKDDSKMGCVGC